ncbi:Caffeoylshikimate esterase [Vitis vinifera]|uniref:Caffeoylshikimate esterase n=1 Tax=Vitis vinifera TaxID=29760 RepID=A0A438GY20_VITVI|nr:Caffeoylshikimate esterase [Vitis vinifera]
MPPNLLLSGGPQPKILLTSSTKPTPENHFRVGESLSLQGLPKTFKNPHSPSTITQTVMSSESEISANFWGDMPEEEYYASQGVRNTKSYFDTPNGKLFTQSFLPLDLPVKASVYMTTATAPTPAGSSRRFALTTPPGATQSSPPTSSATAAPTVSAATSATWRRSPPPPFLSSRAFAPANPTATSLLSSSASPWVGLPPCSCTSNRSRSCGQA